MLLSSSSRILQAFYEKYIYSVGSIKIISKCYFHDMNKHRGKHRYFSKKTNNDCCNVFVYWLFVCTDVCVYTCWSVLAALVYSCQNKINFHQIPSFFSKCFILICWYSVKLFLKIPTIKEKVVISIMHIIFVYWQNLSEIRIFPLNGTTKRTCPYPSCNA